MNNDNHSTKPSSSLAEVPAGDFAALGLQTVAFIKPVMIGSTAAYAIHAADGQQLALAGDRGSAIATVRQNDMEPASVH